MKTYTINLNTIQRINEFVKDINVMQCDIDIIRGRYVIDAKSILGIFSLDVSKPVDVYIRSDDQDDINQFDYIMKKYIN